MSRKRSPHAWEQLVAMPRKKRELRQALVEAWAERDQAWATAQRALDRVEELEAQLALEKRVTAVVDQLDRTTCNALEMVQ